MDNSPFSKVGDDVAKLISETQKSEPEMVNRPAHYTQYQGFEVMDVCRQLNSPDGKGGWYRGNVFKYLARAGWKNPDKEIEDLEKAEHYLKREIDRLKAQRAPDTEVHDPRNVVIKPTMLYGLPVPRYCPITLWDGQVCNMELMIQRPIYSVGGEYVCHQHPAPVFIAPEDALEEPARYCPSIIDGIPCSRVMTKMVNGMYCCDNGKHGYFDIEFERTLEKPWVKKEEAKEKPKMKPQYGYRRQTLAGTPPPKLSAFQQYLTGPADA